MSSQKWGQTRYIPPGPRPLGEKKLTGSERNKKYNKKVKSEIEDVKSTIFSATEELSLHSEKVAELEHQNASLIKENRKLKGKLERSQSEVQLLKENCAYWKLIETKLKEMEV